MAGYKQTNVRLHRAVKEQMDEKQEKVKEQVVIL